MKRDAKGDLITNQGLIVLDYGEVEYRFAQAPFPLYPGEILASDVQELTILPPNEALLLRAVVGFTDENGTERIPGEQWLFEGPGRYRRFLCLVSTNGNIILSYFFLRRL